MKTTIASDSVCGVTCPCMYSLTLVLPLLIKRKPIWQKHIAAKGSGIYQAGDGGPALTAKLRELRYSMNAS